MHLGCLFCKPLQFGHSHSLQHQYDSTQQAFAHPETPADWCGAVGLAKLAKKTKTTSAQPTRTDVEVVQVYVSMPNTVTWDDIHNVQMLMPHDHNITCGGQSLSITPGDAHVAIVRIVGTDAQGVPHGCGAVHNVVLAGGQEGVYAVTAVDRVTLVNNFHTDTLASLWSGDNDVSARKSHPTLSVPLVLQS